MNAGARSLILAATWVATFAAGWWCAPSGDERGAPSARGTPDAVIAPVAEPRGRSELLEPRAPEASAPARHPASAPADAPSEGDARAPLEAETGGAPELDALRRELESMRLALQALGAAVEERCAATSPPVIPSLDLLRAAPEPDWGELNVLIELGRAERKDELRARVYLKSHEELLRTLGRPTRISAEGSWFYDKRSSPRAAGNVRVEFVSSFGSDVTVYPR